MATTSRLTRPQRHALAAAAHHRDGLVYIGSILPVTLACLIRAGLMEAVSAYRGKPTVARITDAGRTRLAAAMLAAPGATRERVAASLGVTPRYLRTVLNAG